MIAPSRLIKINRAVERLLHQVQPFDGHKQATAETLNTFLSNAETPVSRYETLFQYFALGFVKYRSTNGALVYYPGAGSLHGMKVGAIEGFARFFPLAAAWIASGQSSILQIEGQSIDLTKLLHQGIVAGTDVNSSEYWGNLGNNDQRIVEAADIALGLWLSRKQLWSTFSAQERDHIVAWLEPILNRKVYDNNWLLFPVLTLKSLQGLGVSNPKYKEAIDTRYQQYKRHYIGQGWFNDPPKGIDYYNAWAVHYTLFWLNQIDPQFDSDFIKQTQVEFVSFYKYLFSPNGFPIMGRSACYRLAAPVPLIISAFLTPQTISPGFAYRTLDATWRFFVEHGALEAGTVTQGYCQQDLSILDPYSGAGSCLWSLRSLVVAFYVDPAIRLWQAPPEKLPIEVADFSVVNPAIGWQIVGNHFTQHIELQLLKERGKKPPEIQPYRFFNRIVELIRYPYRPDNTAALYHRPVYSTASLIVKCRKSA